MVLFDAGHVETMKSAEYRQQRRNALKRRRNLQGRCKKKGESLPRRRLSVNTEAKMMNVVLTLNLAVRDVLLWRLSSLGEVNNDRRLMSRPLDLWGFVQRLMKYDQQPKDERDFFTAFLGLAQENAPFSNEDDLRKALYLNNRVSRAMEYWGLDPMGEAPGGVEDEAGPAGVGQKRDSLVPDQKETVER